MFKLTTAAALVTAISLAACAPGVTTIQGNSSDGVLTSYQVTAIPPDGKVQNALLVRDNMSGSWVLQMASEALPIGRSLLENILSPGVIPALISGRAGLQIAQQESCGDGVCGTIIYNDGTAVSGSQSAAASNSVTTSSSVVKGLAGHHSSTSINPFLLGNRDFAIESAATAYPELTIAQLESAYALTRQLYQQLQDMID